LRMAAKVAPAPEPPAPKEAQEVGNMYVLAQPMPPQKATKSEEAGGQTVQRTFDAQAVRRTFGKNGRNNAALEAATLMLLVSAIVIFANPEWVVHPWLGLIFIPLVVLFYCVLLQSVDEDALQAMDVLRAGEAVDAKEASSRIDRLREHPVQIALLAECWHPDGKRTITTYSKTFHFRYARCRDISGSPAGLEKYGLAVVKLQPKLEFADQESRNAFNGSKQSILKYIAAHRKDRYMKCIERVSPEALLILRQPGKALPCWMRPKLYCCMSFFCCGTLFRILFAMYVPRVVYYLRKEISVLEEPA